MKNYIQDGQAVDFVAPAGGAVSGVPLIVGGLAVMPIHSAAAGYPCVGATGGVYSLAKKSTDTPVQFQPAFWDEANGHVTTSADDGQGTDFAYIGNFMNAELSGSTVADVRLSAAASVSITLNYAGDALIDFVAPSGGVTEGAPLIEGNMFIIPTADAAQAEPTTGLIAGTHKLAKKGTDEPAQLQAAYWDPVNDRVTVSTDNGLTDASYVGFYKIGVFTQALGTGTDEAYVRLTGIPVAAEVEAAD